LKVSRWSCDHYCKKATRKGNEVNRRKQKKNDKNKQSETTKLLLKREIVSV